VREPEEVVIAYVEGFNILPLSQFAEWAGEIKPVLTPCRDTRDVSPRYPLRANVSVVESSEVHERQKCGWGDHAQFWLIQPF